MGKSRPPKVHRYSTHFKATAVRLFAADQSPLWKEHPHLGPKADFVALPLTNLNDVDLYRIDSG